MDFNSYLGTLKTTIEKEMSGNDQTKSFDLTPANEVGISGDIVKTINFDGAGNWKFNYSKYCPINIDVSAWVNQAPDGSVFDVSINTNYAQHFHYPNVRQGQVIATTIKTNTFSSTSIEINVHSTVPNSTATFHLHYNV